ncbi:acyl-CoA carboxylase subunit epsilon [Streptomyces sp. NPDC059874]|uniref:acyl-CoA carboxylase subunit epsilon n=1 Tax=Streptomyces sp. NPDC059874 TaxID=3346983 RepID=UPI00365C9361
MTNDAPIAPSTPTAPTASLFRVERGHAEPEELAAIALVVACCARRTSTDGGVRDRAWGAAKGAGHRPGHRPARSNTGCWAGCWACR